MYPRTRNVAASSLFVAVLFLSACSAYADEFISTDYRMLDPVIQPAGYATSSGYQLWSTLAEVVLGTSTASSFSLGAGFLRFPLATKPTVTATAGAAQVVLSWTASTGFLGLTPSGYTVGQSVVSGGPYSYTSLGNVLTSTQTGLSNGIPYYFIVVVKDIFGNAVATSTEATATPAASGGGGGGSGGGGGENNRAPFVFGPIIDIPSLQIIPKVCEKTATDMDCDGRVDIIDFSIMYYWYERASPPTRVDLNKDGAVDIYDFSIMAYYWTN